MDALLRWTPSTTSSSEAVTSSDLSATPPGTCFPSVRARRAIIYLASVSPVDTLSFTLERRSCELPWYFRFLLVSLSHTRWNTHTHTHARFPSEHTPVWEITLPETLNTRRKDCSLFFDEPKMTSVSVLCLQGMGQINAFKNFPPLSMNSAFSGSSVLFAVVGYKLC